MGLLQRVSRALGVMTAHIRQQGGVVGDFQGDAAMGFWGWPLPQNDAVLRTCLAALAVARRVRGHRRFSRRHRRGHGRAVAGKIGTVDQAKVTVFGPVVNLASRLEGMTKIFAGSDSFGRSDGADRSRKRCPRGGPGSRLAIVRPYGLDAPLEVSELLPPATQYPELTDEHLECYEAALVRVSREELAQGVRAIAPHPGRRPGERFSRRLHGPAQPPPAGRLGRGHSVGEQVK